MSREVVSALPERRRYPENYLSVSPAGNSFLNEFILNVKIPIARDIEKLGQGERRLKQSQGFVNSIFIYTL
jgi:hypothetical protein